MLNSLELLVKVRNRRIKYHHNFWRAWISQKLVWSLLLIVNCEFGIEQNFEFSFARFQMQTILSMQVTALPSSGKMIEPSSMIQTLCPITCWTRIFWISSGLRKSTSDTPRRALRALDLSSTRQALAWVEAQLGGTWLLMFPSQSSQRSLVLWTFLGIHLIPNIAISSWPVQNQACGFSIQNLLKKDPSQRTKTLSWNMISLFKNCLMKRPRWLISRSVL